MIVFEILVDLKQFCEYSGDMMQLSFPSRSIIFEFGDYILLDAPVAELLRIQHTEVRQFTEETILSEADPIKLGAFKKQIESNLGNKFSSLKTVRNDKIVKLNKVRSFYFGHEKLTISSGSELINFYGKGIIRIRFCSFDCEQYFGSINQNVYRNK